MAGMVRARRLLQVAGQVIDTAVLQESIVMRVQALLARDD